MNIKICGLTRVADARDALLLGAWALGFIFVPGSKRQVNATEARDILKGCEELNHTLCKVGVFVNAEFSEMKSVIQEAGLNALQLHGDETPEEVQNLRVHLEKEIGKLRIFKALPIHENTLDLAGRYSMCDAILLDSGTSATERGGTGKVGDWELASQIRLKCAEKALPVILAGGLKPSNVQSAIRQVKPFAVDVSSGVETQVREKSLRLLQEFFESAGSEL